MRVEEKQEVKRVVSCDERGFWGRGMGLELVYKLILRTTRNSKDALVLYLMKETIERSVTTRKRKEINYHQK